MNIKKQAGMSMLSMLVVVVLVVSALLLAMRLVPVYMDDFAIASALEAMQGDGELYVSSKRTVRSKLRTRLTIEQIDLQDEEILVDKKKDKMTIDVVYEKRIPLVYNLDMVAKFDHRLEVSK